MFIFHPFNIASRESGADTQAGSLMAESSSAAQLDTEGVSEPREWDETWWNMEHEYDMYDSYDTVIHYDTLWYTMIHHDTLRFTMIHY